jgi:hypothetical protein
MQVEGICKKEGCFMCGKTDDITRHHVIPKELKPLKNITIPLCKEHKDITHRIIKQLYFPKHLRKKINKIYKHANDVTIMVESLRKELQFHTRKSNIGKVLE